MHIQLEKEVWGRPGCSEFMQKLNFEPSRRDMRGTWVTLSSLPVKLDRKTLHLATTAIVAVFGKFHMLSCSYIHYPLSTGPENSLPSTSAHKSTIETSELL